MRWSTSAWSTEPAQRRAVLVLAGAYLASHLPSLAPSLEDIDSINFALGLREFSLIDHQPHPPGYPVFVAMGRLSLAAITTVASTLPASSAEALALALWSAVGGAAALIGVWRLFCAIGRLTAGATTVPVPAVCLLATAPLFWMTGLRPMSDMLGLAAAVWAQALVVEGLEQRHRLVLGALVAGLAAGVRLQSVWLTVPLLLASCYASRKAGAWWLLTRPVTALAVGGLLWAVPLVAASGGVGGYLSALGTQAGEDFAWVDMLWANPTPRRLAFGLHETFVLPWAWTPLAVVVGLSAATGASVLALRERNPLLWLGVAFVPYAAFHVFFQETPHIRYALPLLPPVAWLAARGWASVNRFWPVLLAGTAGVSLWVAVPAGVAYGREVHPAFRAIDDMTRAARAAAPPFVYQHFALRRPLQASRPAGLDVQEPRPSYEWLGPVEHWRQGRTAPVWFLADPRRTDLALIDPYARRDVARYRWDVGRRPELGGARPIDVDWYRLDQPGWFAGEGWSLTPETGGLARAAGTGVDRRPLVAYVRRHSGPMHLIVGGRSLADIPGAILFDVSIDGAPAARWTFRPAEDRLNFLEIIDLPAGVPDGPGDYGTLTITARAESGPAVPPVAIRQFDIQPASRLSYAFGDGWHEAEYDNATGLQWRWTSERSVLRVTPAQGVVLRLRGESPLRYIDRPPHVRVTSGGRVVADLSPSADFDWQVRVPADAVIAGGGTVVIETDRVYLPGVVEGSGDARRLGLRLFDVEVRSLDSREP